MKLPYSLTPWAQQLKIFPEDISLVLGGIARKLSPFFSASRSHEELSNLEPNGYDGVARRGTYERLLLSELAVAEEIADEFVRRAVMNEHLFLNLALSAPTANRISVALFDSGPGQLGSPRIAQLATLIVLSRRAASAGAGFLWGVLQDVNLICYSELNESNILNLLNQRSAVSLKDEHFRRWRESLADLAALEDVWVVGGNEVRSIDQPNGLSLVEIEDLLEVDGRRLKVSVRASSGAERQTILELPDEATSTRLLRNPFAVYNAPNKVSLATKLGSFFFDDNGGKIFARGEGNGLLYIPVSNSPNSVSGRPQRYGLNNPDELLLGAGRLGRSVATVSIQERGHVRLQYPKQGNFRLPAGDYFLKDSAALVLPDDGRALLPIYNVRRPNSPYYQAAFLDGKDNLFALNKAADVGNGFVGRISLLATKVLAAARTESRFVFVGHDEGSDGVRAVSFGEETARRELPFANSTFAVFGRGAGIADKTYGLLAVGGPDTTFVIIKSGDDKYIDASPGSEVVGVFFDPSLSGEVGLIELEEDRRTFNLNVGRKHGKKIFVADDEVVKVVFSHRSPVCAYQTHSGEVTVFSLTRRVPIGKFGN
jgi:hypothetical protein